MKVTDVKVYPVKKEGSKIKAMCQVTFDEVFVVKGIKLIKGVNGLFIAMPKHKAKNEEYYDICYPITADFREEIQDAIIKEAKNYKEDKKKKTRKKVKQEELETEDSDELPF